MGLFDDPRWIGGAGGKKQKKAPAQRVPIEDPDSISSNQVGIIVDAISEGPIEGIVGGLRGVYLDETPVEDALGTSNYRYLQFDSRTGTEDQEPIDLGAGVESETGVNVRLKYAAAVVREVTAPGVDAVRVNIGYGGMVSQDRATGDMHGSAVTISVSAAGDGQPFGPAQSYTVSGKSRSRFTRSYTIARPVASGPWRVRVVRDTPDSSDSTVQNDTYFDSFTEITSARLAYPFTALAAVGIRADEFSQIPTRAYHVKGLRIKVPTNYTPADADTLGAGAYSGEWDGQFQIAYSNNPAWVWYDLATNERYGAGQHIRPESVDKWSLYRIGRYCDELVESGQYDPYGNPLHERRFVMNLALQAQETAYKVLADLASAFRGMAYLANGLISFSQDAPKAPIHQFTPANVQDGLFSYASSARTARHTVALVRWNNPDNYYMPETEYVEDEAAIQRYGVRSLDATAFGCTSRGQAHRLGRWLLATERLEKETVSFKTGIEAATLRPGDIVNIVDPMRGGKRFGGRLKSGTHSRVELDEAVTLDPGTVYDLSILQGGNVEALEAPDNATTLTLSAPIAAGDLARVCVSADLDGDGEFERAVEVRDYYEPSRLLTIGDLGGAGATIRYRVSYILGVVTRTVTADPGTRDSLTVSPPFDVSPEAGQVWVLTEPNLAAKPYRVLTQRETEQNVYEVAALEYSEAKFSEAETGIVLDEPPPEVMPPSDLSIAPPSGLSAEPEIRVGATGPRTFLSLSWTAPAGRVRAYRVRWRLNLGNWQDEPETTATEITLPDARAGFYDFEVVALSLLGQVSRAATIGYQHDEQTPVALSRVTGLELDGQGNGTTFTGHDARFAWRWNEPNVSPAVGDAPAAPPAWFAGFVVRVYDPATNALLREEPPSANPSYSYTLERNLSDGGPRRSVRVEVAVRDVYGRLGPSSQLTVSNPAPPPLSGLRLTGGFRDVWVDFTPPSDADYAGVLVWASTSESFPLDNQTLVSDGTGRPAIFNADPGTRYYVRAAAYDAFGKDAALLNVSGSMAVDTVLVGNPDLADLAVDAAKIRNLIVDTANIRDLAVSTLKIAGNAVTLFETSQIANDRCIIAHDGTGEAGKGQWVAVATARIATSGGPVSLTGLLFTEALTVWPNALAVSYPNVLTQGQYFPRARYRVMRAAVSPPGAQVSVFDSGAITITTPGYALGGVVSRMDSPPAGLWDYQLQLRWDEDVYDVGLVTLGGETPVWAGSAYYYYRQVNSTGGTRWLANVSQSYGEATLDVYASGWQTVGWTDGGSLQTNAGLINGDTTWYATRGPGVGTPYYAGTLPYRWRSSTASQLKIDVKAGSFLTASEFRR